MTKEFTDQHRHACHHYVVVQPVVTPACEPTLQLEMAKARTSNSCNGITDVCAVQVVLPMLDSAVVEPGWISEPDFLTGIALVQAMPGPLFNIAAYVGNRSTLCYGRSNCSVYFEFTDLSLCCCCFYGAAALVVPLLL